MACCVKIGSTVPNKPTCLKITGCPKNAQTTQTTQSQPKVPMTSHNQPKVVLDQRKVTQSRPRLTQSNPNATQRVDFVLALGHFGLD